jgi:hypothetical protein
MKLHLILSTIALTGLVACDSSKEAEITPEAPNSYNFDNVDYSGQVTRLDMLEEFSTYMKTANSSATTLNHQQLSDMFSNANSPFQDADLNGTTKQLRNKCIASEVATIESWIDSLVTSSASLSEGSNGVAGVISSTTNPSKNYLFAANGYEYTQLIEKGIMGAVLYYQTTSVYLGDDKMNVDNTTVVEDKGTAMQHHWDEGFGYLGANNSFPQEITDLRFHAKYCNGRDGMLNTNSKLGNAFIEGRFAIDKGNTNERDVAIAQVRSNYELVIGASAIHYVNSARSNIADVALRNHALSEAYAFVYSLKFNVERSFTTSQIDAMLALFGESLYDISINDMDVIKETLATGLGIETAVADSL